MVVCVGIRKIEAGITARYAPPNYNRRRNYNSTHSTINAELAIDHVEDPIRTGRAREI